MYCKLHKFKLYMAAFAIFFVLFFTCTVRVYAAAEKQYFDWYINVMLDETTGQEKDSDYFATTSDYIELEQGETYTLGVKYTGLRNNLFLFYYDEDYNYINYIEVWDDTVKTVEVQFVLPEGATYIRLLSNSASANDAEQLALVDEIYLYSIDTDYTGLTHGYHNNTISNAADKFDNASSKVDSVTDDLFEDSSKYISDYTDTAFSTDLLGSFSGTIKYVASWFNTFWNMSSVSRSLFNTLFSLSVVFFLLRLKK